MQTNCPICGPAFIGECRHQSNMPLFETEQGKRIKWLEKSLAHKDHQITFLWKLLDDISTAGDMHKPEINGYFKSVNKYCEERSEVANSFDGQTLAIKELIS